MISMGEKERWDTDVNGIGKVYINGIYMKFVLLFAIAMQGGTSIPSNQKNKNICKIITR